LLEKSGLHVQHLSYANTILFPLAVAKRLSERFFPPSEDYSELSLNAGMFNNFLKFILASEAPFITKYGLPFGLSVIAVGRK